ncbi:TauD/TfdA family dioxygenase [Planobispora siamensis]|uniref:TauD/TfdA-like domain-containing protein n=1 Tax=Planobispora siamensis TaxID=936338 RepID=A0A8J3SIP1_9ACTN|nr:TauD/TfdA family dioxygenase [Planobispora siamensis]GIH95231.1 hypothetical protein Psi01_58610 [Planobispora siamensis]
MEDVWEPFEITPESADATVDALVERLKAIPDVGALLIRNKALVIRGFRVTEDGLDRVMDLLLPNRLAYVHGNSPRTKLAGNVYTSTEYPAEYTISMHNELSYSTSWPSRLLFFCQKAAESGGATPVVDGVRWLHSLDPEVREAFSKGVRYTQNLHGGRGLGKSWQETFETGDRDRVADFLDRSGADWQWRPGGGIRISQTRPATTRHPVTGAEVWFNQADQWHPASLGDEAAAELAELMPPEELPQSVTFPDGSPIPDAYVIQARDRGLENAVDVEWREGDLLLIDNVLVGHGRRPYTGSRRVLVAMSD